MTTKHKRIVGDTLLPLNALITLNGDPVDLSSYTVKFQMETDKEGTPVIAETATGITIQPTQTFTASTSTDLLTCNSHGVKQDDQIIVASTLTLPTGLTAATRYFAIQINPNTFGLATTPGGAIIDLTGAGTGTLTFYIVGSVQYVFLPASVATAGEYRGWFTTVSGSSEASYPDDEYGIPIEIANRGN